MASARRICGSSSTTRIAVTSCRYQPAIGRDRQRDDHGGARRPGVSSTASSPPMATENPRATARPRPTPAPVGRSPSRWNGWKTRSALGGRDARALVDDPHSTWPPTRRRPRPGPARPGGDQAERVVDQVGQHPLEQGRVGVDPGQRLGHVDLDDRRGRGRRGWPGRPGRSPPGRPAQRWTRQHPGLEAAHVEQVPDQRGEAVGLLSIVRQELRASSGGQSTSPARRLVRRP